MDLKLSIFIVVSLGLYAYGVYRLNGINAIKNNLREWKLIFRAVRK